MNQLSLEYGARWLTDAGWGELLEEARAVISEIGLKQVAYDLDVAASSVSNALAQRDRHAFRGEWLLYLALRDPRRRILHKFAELAAGKFIPDEPLTEGERLRRIEGALDSLDPDLAALVRRKAGLR